MRRRGKPQPSSPAAIERRHPEPPPRARVIRRLLVPTLEGLGALATCALLGFASWHSGTNLVYLLFAAVLAMAIVGWVLAWRSLRRVAVSRLLPRQATALEESVISLVVSNGRRLSACYGVRLLDKLATRPGDDASPRRDGWLRGPTPGLEAGIAFAIYVPAGSQARADYKIIFPRRGRYGFGQVRASTRQPFGLFERSMLVLLPGELLVLPPTFRVDEATGQFDAAFGEMESRRKGEGSEFHGLREYASGDSARRIHWRSSVKSGRLMLREHERDEHRRATIVLMNAVAEEELGDDEATAAFERAVSLAASVARHFIEIGYEARLATSSDGITDYDSTPDHLHSMHRLLAALERVPTGPKEPPPADDSAMVIIAFCDAGAAGAAGSSAGARATQAGRCVLDAREWEIRDGAFTRRRGKARASHATTEHLAGVAVA